MTAEGDGLERIQGDVSEGNGTAALVRRIGIIYLTIGIVAFAVLGYVLHMYIQYPTETILIETDLYGPTSHILELDAPHLVVCLGYNGAGSAPDFHCKLMDAATNETVEDGTVRVLLGEAPNDDNFGDFRVDIEDPGAYMLRLEPTDDESAGPYSVLVKERAFDKVAELRGNMLALLFYGGFLAFALYLNSRLKRRPDYEEGSTLYQLAWLIPLSSIVLYLSVFAQGQYI